MNINYFFAIYNSFYAEMIEDLLNSPNIIDIEDHHIDLSSALGVIQEFRTEKKHFSTFIQRNDHAIELEQ